VSIVGQSLGSYHITAKIAEGGMGTIYVAEHALIGRKVAVKVLKPEYSNNPEALSRFFNEARSTAKLRHPALVDIYDFGVVPSTGVAYIIMDYLEGETLDARIRALGQLPIVMAVDIASQIAAGVSVAHGAGIIHRDLKPDNVFLVRDPVRSGADLVKLLDFGIAKLLHLGTNPPGATKTNAVFGTPLYMSPEQCRGAGAVDHRTDIYSFGCIFYAMLLGRPPFDHAWAGELIAAHLHQTPAPPRKLDQTLPAELEHIILQALAKEPAQRQPSMQMVLEQLQAFTAAHPTVGRRPNASATITAFSSHPPVAFGPAPSNSPTVAAPMRPDVQGISSPTVAVPTPPSSTILSAASSPSDNRPPMDRSRQRRVTAVLALAAVAVGAVIVFARMKHRSSDVEVDGMVLVQPNVASAETPAAPRTPVAAPEQPIDRPVAQPVLPEAVPMPHASGASAPVALPDVAPEPRRNGQRPAPAISAPRSVDNQQRTGATVRVDIANARDGLEVLVDGRRATLPLRLPRDSAMHELRFQTPHFKPESAKIRADKDQSVRLKNDIDLY
jgi:serine/threonine-protein kinase